MQTNLFKPKTINVEQLGINRAKVTLEPFEPRLVRRLLTMFARHEL